MRFKQVFIYFSLVTFNFSLLCGQVHYDHIAPLRVNPVLVNYTNQVKQGHKALWRLLSDSIMAKLPFRDDFSHGDPYPNDSLWMDNAAYINNTYPISPPNLGVATLDGVNNEGQPYNPNCPAGASYPADSLTSRPIDMSKYPYNGADSIWFSFYWQAGGRGMPPLTSDTLLLQFRTSGSPWTTIWYQLGYTPAPPDTGFHLVMIKMLDTIHDALNPNGRFNPYDANFQFRFKNYACTSANADQWNIDDVYLNKGRTYKDTIQYEVAFAYEAPSLLANYEYMPWEQFTANDLADTDYLTGRNNTGNLQNLTEHTDVVNYTGTANANTFPGYITSRVLTHIPIKSQFNYSPLAGPTTITVTHSFTFSAGTITPWFDTLRFKQIFYNYYAYDDSTAEASYFINGTAPMDLAEEITLNKADTLRGLELYFNYMFVNPSIYNMILAVWDNTGPNGSPGNLLFQNSDTDVSSPRTSDTLNGFTYYPFRSSTPLRYSAGQSIYVGWIQTNGDSLNIGFDLNTNSQSKICYNANIFPGYWSTGWSPDVNYPGSLMMRPVFGTEHFHSPVLSTSDVTEPLKSVRIYPNPAENIVNLSNSMPANTMLKIYTADGRECLSDANFYGNAINTSSLSSGFYILEVTPPGGQPSYQKLLIQR